VRRLFSVSITALGVVRQEWAQRKGHRAVTATVLSIYTHFLILGRIDLLKVAGLEEGLRDCATYVLAIFIIKKRLAISFAAWMPVD
jgi:hypothetical protein